MTVLIVALLACVQTPAPSFVHPPEPEAGPGSADTAIPLDTASGTDTDSDTSLPLDTGDLPPLAEVITDPCTRGETGPDRDCGYAYRGLTGCLLGQDVPYDFGPDPLLDVQALRICRTTSSSGVPCERVAAVAQAVGRDVRFRCPRLVPGGTGPIGGNGGGFSIYTAEAWP